MLCPKCHDQVLVPVERQGVEVDYCPGCRGVWLDRGELDKLIEQAASLPPTHSGPSRHETYEERRHNRRDSYRDEDDYREDRGKRRKGMSRFLEDFFDFD